MSNSTKSPVFTDAQTAQLAQMIAAAFAAAGAVEVAGEVPAKATHSNAAGRLVDGNGRFVKDAQAAPKAPAKVSRPKRTDEQKAAATDLHVATKVAMHDLVNKPLADALRAAGKPAKGAPWDAAKALLADEVAAVKAAVKAGSLPTAKSFEAAIAAAAVRA